MRRPIALLVLSLVLFGCSDGGDATGSGTSDRSKRISSTSIPVTVTGTPSSALIGRDAGGSIRVTLADSSTATLTIPAGALGESTLVRVLPLSYSDGVGISIEPSGTWLEVSAIVSFDRAGDVLVRTSPGPTADLFTAISSSAASIPIVRLRPVLVGTIPATIDPTETREAISGLTWTADIAPHLGDSNDASAGEPDQIDVAALAIESDGPRSGVETSRTADVRTGAAKAADALAPTCDDRTTTAAARISDTLTTAGDAAKPPKCVKRVLQLIANLEGQLTGDGATIEFSSVITGHGFFTAEKSPSTLSIPLMGTEHGTERLASFAASGVVWGFGQLANVATPPPNDSSCAISPLENGMLGGTAELGTDRAIRFSLTPAGRFTITCPLWGSFPSPPLVWEVLPDLGLSIPIQLSVPDGRNSVRVLSELINADQSVVTKATDGSVKASDGGITISISLSIGVFWSRGDRCELTPEERGREAELCGTGGS